MPSSDREEQHGQQRQRPARRLEDPAEHAPGAARQVLDHHQRQRAERDAEEQQVGDQPGAEEVVAVDDEADGADRPGRRRRRSARASDARRDRRPACEYVVSTFSVPPARRLGAAGRSSSARRSAGTSSTVASLAELQRADVRGDRPAVGDRHLRRVVLHRAEAVGHHVEEVADRRVAQPLLVVRRRLRGSRAARSSRCPRRSGRGTASRTR